MGKNMKSSPTGYSGTPLPRKLGFKSRMRVLAVNAPPHFRGLLSEAPADLAWLPRLAAFDCAVAFATSVSDLRTSFTKLEPKLAQDGMIWIACPKKASGMKTELDENVVRDIGLDVGLIDIKVCAIDATWSGLKFVRRVRDRMKWRAANPVAWHLESSSPRKRGSSGVREKDAGFPPPIKAFQGRLFAGMTSWLMVVSSRFSPESPTLRATRLRGERAAR
jgi:hypothetical protein